MSTLQAGSRRSSQHGPTPLIYGVLLAIVVMAAVAYFVAAMGGTQYSPPYATGAPATYAPGAPATFAPGAPATYAPVAPATKAPAPPHYP